VGGFGSVKYQFTPAWSATLFGGLNRYVSSAGGSPIPNRIGSLNDSRQVPCRLYVQLELVLITPLRWLDCAESASQLRRERRGGFDLVDAIHRRVEGEKGRGVPGLEIAHRLKNCNIIPSAIWRGAIFLEMART